MQPASGKVSRIRRGQRKSPPVHRLIITMGWAIVEAGEDPMVLGVKNALTYITCRERNPILDRVSCID
jgi:hypothetical protein